MYGKISWKDLVQPSVILAYKGFEVSRDLAHEASKNGNLSIFGQISAGGILRMPKIGDILDTISKQGTNGMANFSFKIQIYYSK